MSVQCMGSGAPTVWLVSDLGLTGAEGWDGTGVAEGLADQVQVCTNDRPGLGASGPATSDRTVEQQADDLAAVIEASGASTPVVVVGQGAGTFIARMLAQRSLPLVAGMVLIDPVLWTSNAEPSADASAGVVAELAGLDLVDADLGGYGSAALPPPPVPTVVLGAPHTRPARPAPATPARRSPPLTCHRPTTSATPAKRRSPTSHPSGRSSSWRTRARRSSTGTPTPSSPPSNPCSPART